MPFVNYVGYLIWRHYTEIVFFFFLFHLFHRLSQFSLSTAQSTLLVYMGKHDHLDIGKNLSEAFEISFR